MNSSAGGSLRHTRLVEALHEGIEAAVAECPLGARWLLRRDGDSMTVAVPPDVSKGEVLGEFPHRVDREVRRFNFERTSKSQLSMRMAVAHGDVVVGGGAELLGGDALIEAARIRDIDPLREAMAVASEAFIGLVVTDDVYRTAIRDGDPALMPHAYRSVTARSKNYEGTVWIRLLGADPPRDDGSDATREPRPPQPEPSPAGTNMTADIRQNSGIVQFGSGSTAGIFHGR